MVFLHCFCFDRYPTQCSQRGWFGSLVHMQIFEASSLGEGLLGSLMETDFPLRPVVLSTTIWGILQPPRNSKPPLPYTGSVGHYWSKSTSVLIQKSEWVFFFLHRRLILHWSCSQMRIIYFLSESTSTVTLQTQNGPAVRTILSFWTFFCRDYHLAPS